MRESFPMLLTEALDARERELTHQHIESCDECTAEWLAMREAWRLMDELPELTPPPRMRQRFLAEIGVDEKPKSNVVPFQKRTWVRWMSQAAAVVIVAGGSYLVGHRSQPVTIQNQPATIGSIQPVSLAESRVVRSSALSPNIEGRPDIENVQFSDTNPNDDEVSLAFDLTQHMTVTGKRSDKSMVQLMAYVMENEDKAQPSATRAIDIVKQTYGNTQQSEPVIAGAVAKVLRNDEHEGVRIKAIDTLKTLPTASTETREALIAALKNDPNPAVRIKAVDALARIAASGQLDEAAVDTLRQKAMQADENLYVRTKAAEALKQLNP